MELRAVGADNIRPHCLTCDLVRGRPQVALTGWYRQRAGTSPAPTVELQAKNQIVPIRFFKFLEAKIQIQRLGFFIAGFR